MVKLKQIYVTNEQGEMQMVRLKIVLYGKNYKSMKEKQLGFTLK